MKTDNDKYRNHQLSLVMNMTARGRAPLDFHGKWHLNSFLEGRKEDLARREAGCRFCCIQSAYKRNQQTIRSILGNTQWSPRWERYVGRKGEWFQRTAEIERQAVGIGGCL